MTNKVPKIEYRQMRLEISEGGAVVLWWPAHLNAENVQMLQEVFELQMRAHLRSLERKADSDAALQSHSEGEAR